MKKIILGIFILLHVACNVYANEPIYLECSVSGKYLNGEAFKENPLIIISDGYIDISNSLNFLMLEPVNISNERFLAILEISEGKYQNGGTYSEKIVVEINRFARTIFINDIINNFDKTTDGFTATGLCFAPKSKLPKKK